MEVIGNVDMIKGFIEKKYQTEIKQLDKETELEIQRLKEEAKKREALHRSKIKTMTDAESRKAYSKIISEEELKAKRDFEEAREALIGNAFSELGERAKDIAHSKRYLDFVKQKMPKSDGMIIADSDFYKKYFGDVQVDSSIIGIKFQVDNITYDLSLDGMIESRRDMLRHKVSKSLFDK